MIVSVLGSGSKGNCTYIAEGDDAILVDAGLNWKQTKNRAKDKNLDLDKVKAIVVTHIHIDHIGNAYAIATKIGSKVDIWVDDSVAAHMAKSRHNSTSITEKGFKPIYIKGYDKKKTRAVSLFGSSEDSPSFNIIPLSLSHDTTVTTGTNTLGYEITSNKTQKRMAIITDTGVIPVDIRSLLLKSALIVLESNHDRTMLLHSDYPEKLKERIDSDIGHLSNEYSAQFVNTLNPEVTRHVVLAHISEDNNSIDKINKTFSDILVNNSPMLHCATQGGGSSVFLL